MKTFFNLIKGSVVTLCILLNGACVDNSFVLNDVNTNVTIISEKTTLTAGYLENKTVETLLSTEEVEGLSIDQEGNYLFSFVGDGDSFSFGVFDSKYTIPESVTTVSMEYPSFSLTEHEHSVDEEYNIGATLNLEGYTGGLGGITTPIPVPAGYHFVGEQDASLTYNVEFEVPQQLSNVTKVYLKPTVEGNPGAEITATFKLNDLNPYNGGGHVNIELDVPEGYELYDEDKALVPGSHYKVREHDFAAGEGEVEFTCYLRCVTNTSKIENGLLTMPCELKYHISYEMDTVAGTITNPSELKLPTLHIVSNLEYDDAEIVLNATNFGAENSASHVVSIDGLTSEVKRIDNVDFGSDSVLQIFVEGLDWFSEELANNVQIEASLPTFLKISGSSAGTFDTASNTLTTSLGSLKKGIALNLDAIAFGSNGFEPKNGTISFNLTMNINAGIAEGTTVLLSQLQHEGDVRISAGIRESNISIESISGLIDYSFREETSFEFGDGISELPINIEKLDVSPIVELWINNSISVPVSASATITPVRNGVNDSDGRITIKGLVIKPATFENGAVQSTKTRIIIADEDRRQEYEGEDVQFVAHNIATLFEGELPESANIIIEANTNPTQVSTLYAADMYVEEYGYSLTLPLAFGSDLLISYEDDIEIGNLFSDISLLEEVTADNISIIVSTTSTLPLELSLSSTLLNIEDKECAVQLNTVEGKSKIAGSPDGKTPVSGEVVLKLDLDKNQPLTQLSEVNKIRLKVSATGSAASSLVPLKKEQYIGAKVKVCIEGGVSADIRKLIEKNQEGNDENPEEY
ncbi:MAG: hypothetical protein IJ348_02380 [Alistipes sp.]|nr:hypothetical protein [Alistipes sp.]